MNRCAHPPWRPTELAYCSNVHPGESRDELLSNIRRFVAGVRRARGLRRMFAGLWISAGAARAFNNDSVAEYMLGKTLAECGLEVATLNGFPYGDFHAAAVKELVYSPDWSEPQRAAYTLDLARVLSRILPETCSEGTISTLPLGFSRHWNLSRHESACRRICRLVADLDRLAARTGRHVRVCFEMEPDCVLETTQRMIRFLRLELPAMAAREGVRTDLLDRHLGVCYDVCHQAVMFESAGDSLEQIRAAGITLGKIQISSALHAPNPSAERTRRAFAEYAEPRYLHQVRQRDRDGTVTGVTDLPAALEGTTLSAEGPWRVHFHVPLQAAYLEEGALVTTREEIFTVLDFLAAHPDVRPHMEVETYTWEVLPESQRPGDDETLIAGLARELDWLEQHMARRGLLESDDDA